MTEVHSRSIVASRSARTALTILMGVGTSAFVLAGPLTPPLGPVSPSFKTLTEVEPRTAINAANTPGDATSLYRITQPGSYYLTGNVSGVSGKYGIFVAADGVTIDLAGFTMIGGAGTLDGIRNSPTLSLVVRNGRVYSWGGDGVHISGNDEVVEQVTAESNTGWGIFVDTPYPSNRISRCSAGNNLLGGISAGQSTLVDSCAVWATGGATGIVVFGGSRVTQCTVWNSAVGIQSSGNANTVQDCSTYLCPVGILASGAEARIEHNTVRTNSGQVGLRSTTAANAFIDNVVSGPGDKYDFATGSRLRLLISQLPESIDWPAEVRVTGSLTGASGSNGLVINADNVTVDLQGHSLIGVAGSLDGITVTGARRNVVVKDGAVQSWGGDGIDTSNASSTRVQGVCSTDNSGSGIRAGERAVVRECLTRTNSGDNIIVGSYSQVIDCIADNSTGGHGINASFVDSLVRGCVANANAQSGIRASQRTLVQGCVASGNTLHGVHATFAGTVEHCFINGNSGNGVLVDAGGAVMIRNNNISESSSAGKAGINLAVGLNQVESNTVVLCTVGILAPAGSTANVVIRNTLLNNATALSIVAGNAVGPLNTSANIATATNPFANVSN